MKQPKLLHDRIFVRQSEALTETVAGIIIPESVKRKPYEGVVIHKGECDWIEIGERVMFDKFSGDLIQFRGEPIVSLRAKDIIIVL